MIRGALRSLALGLAVAAAPSGLAAPPGFAPAILGDGQDLYLEVFINGNSSQVVAAFRHEADGRWTADPQELIESGLAPNEAARTDDGRMDLARLPGVTMAYDEAGQAMRFTAQPEARATRQIEAGPTEARPADTVHATGALLNYTLYAAAGSDRGWDFEGISGLLEGRIFGPWGTLTAGAIATSHPEPSVRRLETTWTYVDREGPTAYSAGDVITGGFAWTRPVRIGGIQVRRSFSARPDLITTPLVGLRGAADVPSTLYIYVDGIQRVNTGLTPGPFQVNNLPIITGGSTARIVVRDALGRETVSEQAFFTTPDMLAAGLVDFSLEAGFARRDFGTIADSYDRRFMAAASIRYGLTDTLTVEAHAEGGGGLFNGGVGATASLGGFGVASIAVAASSYDGRTGTQFAAAFEATWRSVRIYARTQRTFGDYEDIASVTADPARHIHDRLVRVRPPRAIDQVAVSMPTPYQGGSFNLSYTAIDDRERGRTRLIGASLSQPIDDNALFFASAFRDLDSDNTGIYAGVSINLGDDLTAAASVSRQHGRAIDYVVDLIKADQNEVGDLAWRVRVGAGGRDIQAAQVSYRLPQARVEGTIARDEGVTRVTAQLDGAIVIGGGGVFLSNRIDDAFAIVDAGAPGVAVQLENRAAGMTDADGLLLVPGLGAWRNNRLSIDATTLPLEAVLATTTRFVAPPDRGGVYVRFDGETRPESALVSFRRADGAFVETGTTGRLDGAAADFIVGYDGEAFILGLGAYNRVVLTTPTGTVCAAEFAFTPEPGAQVRIAGVPCISEPGSIM